MALAGSATWWSGLVYLLWRSQMREAVARKADWVVSDFTELMAYLA